jgi:membrane protein
MTLDSLRLAVLDIMAVTRRAFATFGLHECTQRSAALAYYAFFSMFPLLLLSISILGFMLEAGVPLAVDAQTVVFDAVNRTLPQAQDLVEQIVLTTRRSRGGTGLVGLIVLAWAASNMFTHARLAFNVIWNTGQPRGIGGAVRLRITALAMAIGTGLLLMVATFSDAIVAIIGRYITLLPWSDMLWAVGRPLLLSAITVVLVTMLYRFLPRARPSWGDVWPGAIVAGIGWELLKRGFVWYTTSVADWNAVYGPITGVIGLLLWLYLSAQVLLFGAEFAAGYHFMLTEKRPKPHPDAMPVPGARPQSAEQAPAPSRHPLPALSGEPLPTLLGNPVSTSPRTDSPVPSEETPHTERTDPSLARGTVVGLIGAGIAGGMAAAGLLATGWRFFSKRAHHGTSEDPA